MQKLDGFSQQFFFIIYYLTNCFSESRYRDSPVSVVSISAVPGIVLIPVLVRFFQKKMSKKWKFSKKFQSSFNFFQTFFKHIIMLFNLLCSISNKHEPWDFRPFKFNFTKFSSKQKESGQISVMSKKR